MVLLEHSLSTQTGSLGTSHACPHLHPATVNETEGAEKRQLWVDCKLSQLSSQERGACGQSCTGLGTAAWSACPSCRAGSPWVSGYRAALRAQAKTVTVGVLPGLNGVTGSIMAAVCANPYPSIRPPWARCFFFWSDNKYLTECSYVQGRVLD